MYELTCEICGEKFLTPCHFKRQCKSCLDKQSNKEKAEKQRREAIANKIHEDNRAAQKLGLSYGEYMAKYAGRE